MSGGLRLEGKFRSEVAPNLDVTSGSDIDCCAHRSLTKAELHIATRRCVSSFCSELSGRLVQPHAGRAEADQPTGFLLGVGLRK